MSPAALITVSLFDLIFGDPRGFPHPVVLMGGLISFLKRLSLGIFQTPRGKRFAGVVITATVVVCSYMATFFLIRGATCIHPRVGWAVSVFLAYTTLAARSLHREAGKIMRDLEGGDLSAARRDLGGIVGRQTGHLSEKEVVRATVETVTENTSDGVIAPLFYLALGGAPLAMAYKAVNTLDSMLGYRHEVFRDLGWFPARLDDVVNFIPARITGLLMAPASFFIGGNAREAFRTMLRDGRKHPSPNAGIPEAAAAGALGVQLGGVNVYMGVETVKPVIGEARKELTPGSIRDAIALMYGTFCLMVLVLVVVLP